jgi:hypothetical protein
MANTFIKIASATVGSGGAASISFSGITQTGYTDLLIKMSVRHSSAVNRSYINFNSTSTTYRKQNILGTGSAFASEGNTNNEVFVTENSSFTSNVFANSEIYIPNYTSSYAKSCSIDSVTENNASTSYQTITAVNWDGTAAITSVTIYPISGNYAEYSTATLYGIKNS